jgi:hypothetical protein
MSTATYVGNDLITSGAWLDAPTRRGSAGYYFADDVSTLVESLPSYVSGVVNFGPSLCDVNSTAAYRLARPGGGAPMAGRFYSDFYVRFDITATDSDPHYLSVYCCADPADGRQQTVDVWESGNLTLLASHTINYDFTHGVWVCFQVSGSVIVRVTPTAGPNSVVSGIAWDETEPPTATAGSAIPASGSLALDDLTLSGAGSAPSGIDAVGSLAIDALDMTGSAAVSIPSTGSLALDDLTLSGSASVVVDATGSLVLDPIVIQGSSASVVFASGSLAIDALTFTGSAGVTVPAVGSLALDSIAIAGGGAPPPIDAVGSLAIDALTATGAAGVTVAASGSLAIGDVTLAGSSLPIVAAAGGIGFGGSVVAAVMMLTVDPYQAVLIAADAAEPLDVDPYQAVLIQ